MLRGELRQRGTTGRCEACDEIFPCGTADQLLELELKRRLNQNVHERTRPDKIAVAIEHLEQAMVALFMASQE